MAKIDSTNNLKIEEVWIRQHEHCPDGVIGFDWSSDAGFGRYELIMDKDGMLHAQSEHMDNNQDKTFIKALLEKLLDKIVVDE